MKPQLVCDIPQDTIRQSSLLEGTESLPVMKWRSIIVLFNEKYEWSQVKSEGGDEGEAKQGCFKKIEREHTVSLSLCLGVRSPCRITASTHNSSLSRLTLLVWSISACNCLQSPRHVKTPYLLFVATAIVRLSGHKSRFLSEKVQRTQ
jgi:hypothetical protein